MTTATMTAPKGHDRFGMLRRVADFFRHMSRAFAEARRFEYLYSLTDEQLAARGLTRERLIEDYLQRLDRD